MSGQAWHTRSAWELAGRVRSGELGATELLDVFLARARADRHGCFVELWEEDARREAGAVDAAVRRGDDPGPLAGVPVAIKDNYVVEGRHTACASRILEGFVAPYTATAVARLRAAGAVLLGRTNMDEFAMGSSNEHSVHGPTRNPFAPDRSPGGSSGGSAAAVAARLCPLALGSDTGGSVRQPAALCGVPGFKPTYGRVSRRGLVAYASSLDTVAWFGRDARDLALAGSVLAGGDAGDATSLDVPPPAGPETCTDRGLEGVTVGVPEEAFGDGLDPEVAANVRTGLGACAAHGARVVPVALPHLRFAVATYYLIAAAEASSNLARFDGVRYGRRAEGASDLHRLYRRSRSEGFGDEVQRRILLGTFALRSGYYEHWYRRATQVRTLMRRDFEEAFEHCTLVATPTSPVPAFGLGETLDDPVAQYLNDALTVPANLAGIPAVSVPVAPTAAGLPVGLQLAGPPLAEERVLAAAQGFLAATGHHLREPAP